MAAMTEDNAAQKLCPVCGYAEKDFAKTLRLGCAHCYDVFAPELSTFLPEMHRGRTHVGKVPKSFSSASGALVWELREVESLLSHGVCEQQSDQLLDRWKELSVQIETLLKSKKELHENS